MILTKIRLEELHPMTGVTRSWPLAYCDFNLNSTAGENGYVIKDSVGMDAPKIVSVAEGFDAFGTAIMTGVPENREMVIKIGFDPGIGQTYSSLREALYKFINRTVTVKLMNESEVIAQTTGYIEHSEADYFTAQPGVDLTISCNDGEFIGPASVVIPSTEIAGLHPVINYDEGTAPTGLDLRFVVTANTAAFTVSNHARVWFVGADQAFPTFTLTYPMVVGDVVNLNTHLKDKKLTLTRAGVTYDLAGYLNGGAIWPRLFPGVNAFDWTFATSWMTWQSATYKPRYWGV